MRDGNGRVVARLGDETDHGGKIIEGAIAFTHAGIPIALDGHKVECPKCGDVFVLVATGQFSHKSKRVAFVGDKTSCGATVIRV